MRATFDPFSFVVISIAGWMNQHQQHVIDYLIEENRVLREQIGPRCGGGVCSVKATLIRRVRYEAGLLSVSATSGGPTMVPMPESEKGS
jgi:hypothetical protein